MNAQPELDLYGAIAAEPAWRIDSIGPPHAIHAPDCGLDPRHHIETRCIAIPAAQEVTDDRC